MFAIKRQGFTSWRGKDFLYTMFSHQCSCRVSLHREISHAGPPHQQFAALHQSLIQFLCPAVHAILSSLVQFSILFFLYLFLGTPQPVLEMPINRNTAESKRAMQAQKSYLSVVALIVVAFLPGTDSCFSASHRKLPFCQAHTATFLPGTDSCLSAQKVAFQHW